MLTATLSRAVRSERLVSDVAREGRSLSEAVWNALSRTGYEPLRTIALQDDGFIITLSGQVPTYFLKQVAHAAASSVAGVRRVNDELCVVSPN